LRPKRWRLSMARCSISRHGSTVAVCWRGRGSSERPIKESSRIGSMPTRRRPLPYIGFDGKGKQTQNFINHRPPPMSEPRIKAPNDFYPEGYLKGRGGRRQRVDLRQPDRVSLQALVSTSSAGQIQRSRRSRSTPRRRTRRWTRGPMRYWYNDPPFQISPWRRLSSAIAGAAACGGFTKRTTTCSISTQLTRVFALCQGLRAYTALDHRGGRARGIHEASKRIPSVSESLHIRLSKCRFDESPARATRMSG